jgi:hypothetical protein
VQPSVSPFSDDFHDYSTTSGLEFIANELRANSSLKRVETTILLPPEQITPDLEGRTREAVRRYCRARSHTLGQDRVGGDLVSDGRDRVWPARFAAGRQRLRAGHGMHLTIRPPS